MKKNDAGGEKSQVTGRKEKRRTHNLMGEDIPRKGRAAAFRRQATLIKKMS